MNKLTKSIGIAAVISVMSLTGCAEYGGYTPVIDQSPIGGYNDPSYLYQQNQQNSRLNQDMTECRQLAKRSSGGALTKGAIGAVGGGLIGAAGGAIVGAFTGNPAAGAAIGAAGGAFGGAAHQGLSADQRFKQSYNNCLASRGHRVVQ